MTMTRTSLILLASAGSVALLLGAFAFQYIGGMAPCQLCLWQRWPHAAAVAIGALALATGARFLPALGAVAAFTSAGIGAFHVGVEQKLWEGLATCTASSLQGVSTADLLNPDILVAAPIRCDAIAWSLMGVSMAGWNVIISLALAALWLAAQRRA
jgi:disulfide bond formation protein DsbB